MEKINLSRLKNCMLRAEKGEELTIGFLGGSITQGSLSTKPENCYAHRVFSWWKKEFRGAQFHYVNGGIGGTSSHFGVSRAVTDLLMYQPDVVVVDFSVNDKADIFFRRPMRESLENFSHGVHPQRSSCYIMSIMIPERMRRGIIMPWGTGIRSLM